MLRRVRIQRYKSLHDLEIVLDDLSVLVGPNAAGKSNFLDALQLLSKLATTRTLKEAFEPPYRGRPLESFEFGEGGLKELLENDLHSFSIEADITLSSEIIDAVNRQIREMRGSGGSSESPHGNETGSKKHTSVKWLNLRYRIVIQILPKTGILRVADEYLAPLNEKGELIKGREPYLSLKDGRFHLRLEGQSHPLYFEQYLDHSILSLPLYPPHYPHITAARREFESWHFFYFEPRERMRAPNPVKEVLNIGMMGEELAAFLNTLKVQNIKQYKGIENALKLIIPSVEGLDIEINALGEVELKLQETGKSFPSRIVSEGTLRILGLLSLVGSKNTPSLVGFEEPENGIHPRRIQLVADLIKNQASSGTTQYVVTTHSPLLADSIDNKYLLFCKKDRGRTTMKRSVGPIFRNEEIGDGLQDHSEINVSQMMLRGDYEV